MHRPRNHEAIQSIFLCAYTNGKHIWITKIQIEIAHVKSTIVDFKIQTWTLRKVTDDLNLWLSGEIKKAGRLKWQMYIVYENNKV